MTIDELITQLSTEPGKKSLKPPRYYAFLMSAILIAYAIIIQCFLGLRNDLPHQFIRGAFAAEIILLVLLSGSALWAAILSMYPDNYQKRYVLTFPARMFTILLAFIVVEYFSPPDTRMVIPQAGAHNIECALCIAITSLIPSMLIFALIHKGATLQPLQAGFFSTLAATGLGCLTLRLAEESDFMPHLLIWHYIPTLLFSAMGALLGKFYLKW